MVRICMIGTGYVGLVSGACMADFGNEVWCVDIDSDRIEGLQRGVIPFYEPGLDKLVEANHAAGRLHFTTSLEEGMRDADTVFIAVQTPMSDNGEADMSYVMDVAAQIGSLLDRYRVIVTKSTVPVGSARRIAGKIRENLPAPIEFDMASNPEFLREGSSIDDFMRPDRVVIGSETEESTRLMREIYRPLYLHETPIVVTGIETAEMIKYASNAFLAVKISYINEMSELAEKAGANVTHLAQAMGLDKRIGPKFLHAGLGFGGSCLPKDTNAIVHIAGQHGCGMEIVRAAIGVNDRLPERAMAKAREMIPDLSGRTIALLGVSFKPNTDDVRAAPSHKLVELMLAAGARVRATDPVAMDNFRRHHPDIEYFDDPYEAATGADLCCLVTEWNQFRQLDFKRLADIMADKAFLDCRNVYDQTLLNGHGFRYRSFGRPLGSERKR